MSVVNKKDKKDLGPYLKPAAAAEILNCSTKTLERWRREGKGPPFTRLSGKAVRYPQKLLEEFANANLNYPANQRLEVYHE